MQVSLLQESLNTALTHVSRFCTGKSQLPILGNILISTDAARLKLSATNLEMGINYWLSAQIDKQGSITVPSKEITEFVSYLPTGKISLSLNDSSLLTVNSSKAESSFATMSPSDFPQIPSLDPSTSFELDYSLLSQSVSQTVFSAAADDTRPVLTAVYWRFTKDTFTMAATDGFRLSLKEIKLVNPIQIHQDQSEAVYLIPAKALSEVVRLSKNVSSIKIGLTQDQHQVVFVYDDLEIVSRLVEGEFPDYNRIIPKTSATKITLDKEEFSQAIKIASVFARESANVIRFSLKSDSVEITANAPQLGHNKAQVEAKIEGNPLEIAFNYKFISDYIASVKGDQITIELNESLSPGLFHDSHDPSYTHVIMPVRLQD